MCSHTSFVYGGRVRESEASYIFRCHTNRMIVHTLSCFEYLQFLRVVPREGIPVPLSPTSAVMGTTTWVGQYRVSERQILSNFSGARGGGLKLGQGGFSGAPYAKDAMLSIRASTGNLCSWAAWTGRVLLSPAPLRATFC